MIYFYGMRLRGFSPGCQPMEGFIRRLDGNDRFHDVLIYDRPLSEEDIRHFSLTPLYGEEFVSDDATSYSYDISKDILMENARTCLGSVYEEYERRYPTSLVVWANKGYKNGNISKVLVDGKDCRTSSTIYSPPKKVSEYIKENKKPVQIGDIVFRLQGVNMLEDTDISEPVVYNDGEGVLSFEERYKKAVEELEETTRGMTIEQAQDFFEKETTDDNANYYGEFVYVYSKKRNPRYMFFGVRMD